MERFGPIKGIHLAIIAAVLFAIGIGIFIYARREHLLLSPAVTNTRQWPYYHYTIPYKYEEGGAWPPNMYTRLSHWFPGYETSGWGFDMRPGFGYTNWPRNRWVKSDGTHYYINNGGLADRLGDYYRAS
jgi:hypothetical protein